MKRSRASGSPRQRSTRLSTAGKDRFAHRNWIVKFRCAIRGATIGIARTESFRVHVPFAFAALGISLWLQLEAWRWAIVLASVGAVMAVELLNSAIETLSRAITREEHPQIRDGLDIASGAVLVASLSSVAVGVLAIGPPLWFRLMH